MPFFTLGLWSCPWKKWVDTRNQINKTIIIMEIKWNDVDMAVQRTFEKGNKIQVIPAQNKSLPTHIYWLKQINQLIVIFLLPGRSLEDASCILYKEERQTTKMLFFMVDTCKTNVCLLTWWSVNQTNYYFLFQCKARIYLLIFGKRRSISTLWP